MPKKRKKRPQTKERQSSTLSQHKRVGRVLQPPMMSLGNAPFNFVNWARDKFPEFVWVCSILVDGDKERLVITAGLIDFVTDAIKEHLGDMPHDWVFDGTLTSFESLPERARAALLEALDRIDGYEDFVPEGMAHVLGLYPDAPGRWLIRPWLDRGLSIDPEAARKWLTPIVEEGLDGRGQIATWAKVTHFRQVLASGRMHFSDQISFVGLLHRYPLETSEVETAQVESSIRASYNMLAMRQESEWPKRFWQSNWNLFPCAWPEPVDRSPMSDADHQSLDAYLSDLRQRSQRLWDDFFTVATTTDPDLYDPDRFEVLTGLIGRVVRYVQSFVLTPPMWTMEHGAPVLRALVETEILFKYLVAQESKEPLYAKFKAYGIGKIKLLKLHLEDHIATFDDPPEDLVSYVEYLSDVVNRDRYEEFQNIDLGGSFAGTDMRKMSQEVGMESEYRFLFAPASGNVHGEWGVIDENVFTTCRNPLHRYHRIVAKPTATLIGPDFVEGVIERTQHLVDVYRDALT